MSHIQVIFKDIDTLFIINYKILLTFELLTNNQIIFKDILIIL